MIVDSVTQTDREITWIACVETWEVKLGPACAVLQFLSYPKDRN
jgi:hypothetical protein